MSEHAHDPTPRPGPRGKPTPVPMPLRREAFSLWAYLERDLEKYADGPTMADIIEKADQHRAGGASQGRLVAAIREKRDEADQ